MSEPTRSVPLTYAAAGVDIDAQDRALTGVKRLARSTFTAGVLSEIGSFGGLFSLDPDNPQGQVLVASADGVGTKLKVAQMAGVHDTVGEDLVNRCVNDILVCGARPLFFLDYFASGRLDSGVMVSVVEGLARGCRANGCALLGGETAEMPGFYFDRETQDRLPGHIAVGRHPPLLFRLRGLPAPAGAPARGHRGSGAAGGVRRRPRPPARPRAPGGGRRRG
ncbi:MAG TPA: AIR synthase related protein, partial [Thermoanaerobaculaceae bacterium]|nr:AIR synthase related protein [Thermoanaerobaculaceae bacterium]